MTSQLWTRQQIAQFHVMKLNDDQGLRNCLLTDIFVLKTHFYKQICEVDYNETSCSKDIEDHKWSLIYLENCLPASLNSVNLFSVWTHV